MTAIFFITAFCAAAAVGVLMWRALEVHERVAIERAKAGEDERAKAVEDLSARVGEIEKYMNGGSS